MHLGYTVVKWPSMLRLHSCSSASRIFAPSVHALAKKCHQSYSELRTPMTHVEYPEYKPASPIIGVFMAKKAKRRGRPPGSKNKKSIGKSVATMDVAQLRAHIDNLQGALARKLNEQRSYFESQLAQLGGY